MLATLPSLYISCLWLIFLSAPQPSILWQPPVCSQYALLSVHWFLDPTYKWYSTVFDFLWLISFCKISSRSSAPYQSTYKKHSRITLINCNSALCVIRDQKAWFCLLCKVNFNYTYYIHFNTAAQAMFSNLYSLILLICTSFLCCGFALVQFYKGKKRGTEGWLS